MLLIDFIAILSEFEFILTGWRSGMCFRTVLSYAYTMGATYLFQAARIRTSGNATQLDTTW